MAFFGGLKVQNLRITVKVVLIVALFATASISTAVFATLRMKAIDDAYSDLIARVDTSTTLSARLARFLTRYKSDGYQAMLETTAEGNAKVLADLNASKNSYEVVVKKVRLAVPEKAELIDAAMATVHKSFETCDPVIQAALATTSTEDNARELARYAAVCDPTIEGAVQAQIKVTDVLIAYAGKASDDLTDVTNGTIRAVLMSVGAGTLVTITVAVWIGVTGLSRPIARLNGVMAAFARNDLAPTTPGLERRDEVGAMARTVEVFKTNALEINRLREDQEAQKKRTADEQRQAMAELAARFETSAGGILSTVTAQATELQVTAGSMAALSEQTANRSATVETAAEQATQSVNTVAGAAEELASSVNEILQQVGHSTRLVGEVVGNTNSANGDIKILADSVQKIGQVVDLIKGIAGQTNLLALNATIEAARAGDAGKGFAVVASEVKTLATQTARATDEIAQQIAAIQDATHRSVRSIEGIAQRINEVSEVATSIASAVEQQGAATAEIARNVAQAAEGTRGVSANMTSVNAAARESGAAAGQVLSAANTLGKSSKNLQVQVETFLRELRVA